LACRQRFEQAFSSQFIAKQYLNLYQKLIQQHSNKSS